MNAFMWLDKLGKLGILKTISENPNSVGYVLVVNDEDENVHL